MGQTVEVKRMHLRLDAKTKRKLERAAAYEETSVTDFVLTNAVAAAERVIDSHEKITLSAKDWEIVTAQVGDLVQDRRRDFAKDVGSQVRASMMAQPCFLAVEKNERMSAKSTAPSTERKPPEISGATSSCGRRARPDCW